MRIASLAVLSLFFVPSLTMAATFVEVGHPDSVHEEPAPAGDRIVRTPQGPRTYTQNPATTAKPAPAATTTTTAPAADADKPATDKETHEIGFDAKVKRDPNGKVIEEGKPAATATTPATGMRSDRGMRNDRGLTH